MLSIRSTASVSPAMSVLRVNRVLEHDPRKLQPFWIDHARKQCDGDPDRFNLKQSRSREEATATMPIGGLVTMFSAPVLAFVPWSISSTRRVQGRNVSSPSHLSPSRWQKLGRGRWRHGKLQKLRIYRRSRRRANMRNLTRD